MPDTKNPPVSPVPTYSLDDLPPDFSGTAVAIGNFDGVHLGHAALIQMAIAEAHQQGARAIVLTFDPHPRTFFRPEQPVFRLTPPADRRRPLPSQTPMSATTPPGPPPVSTPSPIARGA